MTPLYWFGLQDFLKPGFSPFQQDRFIHGYQSLKIPVKTLHYSILFLNISRELDQVAQAILDGQKSSNYVRLKIPLKCFKTDSTNFLSVLAFKLIAFIMP